MESRGRIATTSMKEKSKIIQFNREKETKNTVKFAEAPNPGEPPIIGALYAQKWFVGDASKVKVTIELP